jgi:hypothetical protein
MILSSDEIEILEYLKSWKGSYVSIVEICRCAGGRHKFKESPQWAKNQMSHLDDEHLVDVNDRGHYKYISPEDSADAAPVIEDYFAAPQTNPQIVGDDYFSPEEPAPGKTKKWVSPQIETILKQAAKKPGKSHRHD